MKTAFSSFIYSRRGIYGILHILILLMSLFLVINPLAELSQCILDSSNGSIINVI